MVTNKVQYFKDEVKTLWKIKTLQTNYTDFIPPLDIHDKDGEISLNFDSIFYIRDLWFKNSWLGSSLLSYFMQKKE